MRTSRLCALHMYEANVPFHEGINPSNDIDSANVSNLKISSRPLGYRGWSTRLKILKIRLVGLEMDERRGRLLTSALLYELYA